MRLALSLAAVLLVGLAAVGCGAASQPQPVSRAEISEARSFPYFPLYWVGPRFEGVRLVAADGQRAYAPPFGDSVYYGNCTGEKGIFGGGTCALPLQVKTLVYQRHSNDALGQQRNLIVRGVPAVVYDGGHALELYTGQVAVDVYSTSLARTLQAAEQLRPINAPGAPRAALPVPVYCPELVGETTRRMLALLASLPRHVCRETERRQKLAEAIYP
jgi:hypothetical protein